jgi:hypothetical protein
VTAVVNADHIDLTCTPRVSPEQRVRVLLNEKNVAPGVVPRAYSFTAPSGNGVVPPNTDTATVSIPFSDVKPGNYLVRAQIDGAESALDVDPVTGLFSGPEVVVPP